MTQTYVFDSVQRGSWLPEEPYEVALSQSTQPAHNPVRQWRKRVADGSLPGAFHGWTVLLVVADPLSRAIFKRWDHTKTFRIEAMTIFKINDQLYILNKK